MRISDPLADHLVDLLQRVPKGSLTLFGGLGIAIKQQYLRESATPTVISPFPSSRVTRDMDLFIGIHAMDSDIELGAIRSALDELEYQEGDGDRALWQFFKSIQVAGGERTVRIDLHCRAPKPPETSQVKDDRVKPISSVRLRGRYTPEAFAIDESPLLLQIEDAAGRQVEIAIAHPFASLCMKIRASADWNSLRLGGANLEQEIYSRKHVFDVYVLMAMLTERELSDCEILARRFVIDDEFQSICGAATELFRSETSPGAVIAISQGASIVDFGMYNELIERIFGSQIQ